MTSIEERLDRAAHDARAQMLAEPVAGIELITRRSRARSVVRLAVVGAAVVTCLVAIGSVDDRGESIVNSDPNFEPRHWPSVVDASDDLPLRRLQAWPREAQKRRYEEVERRTGECMRAAGFEYPEPHDYEVIEEPDLVRLREHPFGMWTLAETNGGYFWSAEEYSRGRVTLPTERYVRTLSKAERRAWNLAWWGPGGQQTFEEVVLADGSRKDAAFSDQYLQGCSGKAADGVYLGKYALYEAYGGELAELGSDAWDASERDSRVGASLEEWSNCMTRQGYEYDGPGDAVDEFGGQKTAAGEHAVLVADIGCKDEVRLADVWFTVLAEHQQERLDDHPENVQEFVELKGEILTSL